MPTQHFHAFGKDHGTVFATVLTRVFSKRFHHAHHTVASARFATCTRSSTISRTSPTSSTNARRTNHYTTHLRNMLDCLAAWPSSVRSHNEKWLNKDHRGTAGGLHPTSGGQDGKIGTRRELKTFSQFVDCSRIAMQATEGAGRHTPWVHLQTQDFLAFRSSRFSRLVLYCLNLSLAQKDSIARVLQLLPRALPSVPDLSRASATCWAVWPSRVRSLYEPNLIVEIGSTEPAIVNHYIQEKRFMLDTKNSSDKVSTAPVLEGVDDGPSIGLLISTLRTRKSEVSAVPACIFQSTGESSMSRASHTFCTERPVASHSNSRRSSRHRCNSQEIHNAKSRTLSCQQEHFLRNRGVTYSRMQN